MLIKLYIIIFLPDYLIWWWLRTRSHHCLWKEIFEIEVVFKIPFDLSSAQMSCLLISLMKTVFLQRDVQGIKGKLKPFTESCLKFFQVSFSMQVKKEIWEKVNDQLWGEQKFKIYSEMIKISKYSFKCYFKWFSQV